MLWTRLVTTLQPPYKPLHFLLFFQGKTWLGLHKQGPEKRMLISCHF